MWIRVNYYTDTDPRSGSKGKKIQIQFFPKIQLFKTKKIDKIYLGLYLKEERKEIINPDQVRIPPYGSGYDLQIRIHKSGSASLVRGEEPEIQS